MNTKRLYTAAALAASALLVVACGGSSSNNNIAPAPEPKVLDAKDTLKLSKDEQDALKALPGLDRAGGEDTLDVGADKTVKRAGIEFKCNSAYPCTITIENSLGTITAKWESKHKEKTTEPTVATTFSPPPPPPVATDPEAVTLSKDTQDALKEFLDTVVGNEYTMKLAAGETRERAGSKFTCPNDRHGCDVKITNDAGTIVATSTTQYDKDQDPTKLTVTAVALPAPLPLDKPVPGKPGGDYVGSSLKKEGFGASSLDGLVLKDEFIVGIDKITDNEDNRGSPIPLDDPLDVWKHKALSKDWRGGLITKAWIYSDLEEPSTGHKLNTLKNKVGGEIVRKEGWFDITNGIINISATTKNEQTSEVVISSYEFSGSSTTSTNIGGGAQFDGTYFGVSGKYTCTSGCELKKKGALAELDLSKTPNVWRFRPDDPEAEISLPDQDWIAFGVWETTPADGESRFGTFYEGKEEYDYKEARAGLTGTAEYNGHTIGRYVDDNAELEEDKSGIFTADVWLNINFNVDGKVKHGSHKLWGSISGFKDADDKADLGTGEDAWLVGLDPSAIGNDGMVSNSQISGRADGVDWAGGSWEAQLYGPGHRFTNKQKPTGVAGKFEASSGKKAVGDTPSTIRSVAGAFGAKK